MCGVHLSVIVCRCSNRLTGVVDSQACETEKRAANETTNVTRVPVKSLCIGLLPLWPCRMPVASCFFTFRTMPSCRASTHFLRGPHPPSEKR